MSFPDLIEETLKEKIKGYGPETSTYGRDLFRQIKETVERERWEAADVKEFFEGLSMLPYRLKSKDYSLAKEILNSSKTNIEVRGNLLGTLGDITDKNAPGIVYDIIKKGLKIGGKEDCSTFKKEYRSMGFGLEKMLDNELPEKAYRIITTYMDSKGSVFYINAVGGSLARLYNAGKFEENYYFILGEARNVDSLLTLSSIIDGMQY